MEKANIKINGPKSATREVEKFEPARKRDETPDPRLLLDSLQKKRELVSLLDGYVDKADINEMKKRLNEAIGDLEKIIAVLS